MKASCALWTTDHCSILTAIQIFQESSQLWQEVKLHQEEPECSGGEEQLAVQTGTQVHVLARVCGDNRAYVIDSDYPHHKHTYRT